MFQSDHRKAMLRGMVTFLLENGQIETTVTRAKEVRAVAEKMITIAKSDDLHAKRQVMAYVTKESVAKKLFDEIAPKYADRKGGYTQIVKIPAAERYKKINRTEFPAVLRRAAYCLCCAVRCSFSSLQRCAGKMPLHPKKAKSTAIIFVECYKVSGEFLCRYTK